MKGHKLLLLFLFTFLLGITLGCAMKTNEVASKNDQTKEQPAPIVEKRPTKPAPNYEWVPGSWHWTGKRWVWTSGHWKRKSSSRDKRTWVPGKWIKKGDKWYWSPGHWDSGTK